MKIIIILVMLLVPSHCDDTSDDYDYGPPTDLPVTDWGSPEEFLKEVNDYRAKYAKENRIPNMYKLTWNETLLEALKTLDWDDGSTGWTLWTGWDGYETRWRIAEIDTFFDAVTAIDDAVQDELVSNIRHRKTKFRGEWRSVSPLELIHPLQTSVACTKVVKMIYLGGDFYFISTTCLIGDM
ncbi:hypothetical protein CAEBREN_06032 [Caenorhabditis brenneri]|uniref:Uncharacterized protein n=1 Tax=Caenorhabditis brenneri TaxID=135651 RepID=G0MVV1_CAEBE|nr:hypothetical protein CAEBREN_06032 [Caenorhabditis brenneri]